MSAIKIIMVITVNQSWKLFEVWQHNRLDIWSGIRSQWKFINKLFSFQYSVKVLFYHNEE